MKRTQIYLDHKTIDLLKHESRRSKKNISGLICEALREKYGSKKKPSSMVDEVAGIWSNYKFDSETYVRKLRNDNRITRLYGKK
ncbi:MAG: ribbon-helix-helix domain-containing protein [Chitinophagales bacterium]|nr:ribbon-helix-helix domain-containing protein [Chitinophagales bacterium]